MIWNAAGDYTISPGFRMYDNERRADLYWNTIIGAAHRHFDWKELKAFYNTFHETLGQETYETLFWIALENTTFEKEKAFRPGLVFLREEYCRRKLREFMPSIAESREGWILEGHYRIALGEDSGLPDLVDRKLLREVEIGAEVNTEGFIEGLSKTLAYYFTYLPGVKAKGQRKKFKFALPAFLARRNKEGEIPGAKKLVLGYVEGRGGRDTAAVETRSERYSRITQEGLRSYISSYFGKSLYDEKTNQKFEQECCVGNHLGAKIYFTRGEELPSVSGFAAKMRKEMQRQRMKNEHAFSAEETKNQQAIAELARRIKYALLAQLEMDRIYSNTGKLLPGIIWKAVYLHQSKIFQKEVRESTGNLTVDILLDASASQIHRMETVSTQGYILAKALDHCNVPVRVWGYSSMSGYTVMNLYRDYWESSKNKEIFRFFTTGANRDGLALGALLGQMKTNTASHRLIIWLTDLKPNDMLEVRGRAKNYSGDLAITDMMELVHQARMQEIHTLCAFTGLEEDIGNVQKVFGRNFVKVGSLDHFAFSVGNMIQGEIRRM